MSVPKLRFKGFSKEWDIQKLGTLTTKVGSGSTPKGGVEVYTKGGIIFIRSQNVIGNKLQVDDVHIPESIHKKMSGSKVLPNDILLNITGGSIGRSCVVPTDFIEGNVNQHVAIIRLKNYNPIFFQTILSSEKGQKLIFQAMTGSGREGLNFESIKGFKITFPEKPEQEKIASFLTVIDEKLNLLKEKKEMLELYKRGVMQQIFSQKLRFKDEKGNEFPEWKKIVLGNILTEVVEKSKISNQEEVLSSTAKGLFKQSEYFTREIASSDSTGYKILRKYQLVFSPQNLWLGNINVNLKYEIGIVSPSYKTYKFNSNTTPQYGSCILKLPRMINEYKISSTQGASVVRRNLDMEAFENIPLHLPTLPEQQKIADFLSTLDSKINLVSTQIEKTELWKKGLLQQMFV